MQKDSQLYEFWFIWYKHLSVVGELGNDTVILVENIPVKNYNICNFVLEIYISMDRGELDDDRGGSDRSCVLCFWETTISPWYFFKSIITEENI